MGQAVVRDQARDVRQLSLIRAQKLLAGGHIEEQIANRNHRAGGRCELFALQELAAGELDEGAGGFADRAGFER